MTAISDQYGNTGGPSKPCKDCGHLNPAWEEYCQACNTALTRVDPKADGTASTGRYKDVRAAVDQVQAGALTPEQFATYLEQVSAIMADKARDIVEFVDEVNYWQDGTDEIEMGLAGVHSYEDGLSELWQYSQDMDAMHLEQGLVMIWEGNQRIVEAMRLNRESRQNLALDWELLQGGKESLQHGPTP